MTMMTTFNEHGEYIASIAEVELGPLRSSDVTGEAASRLLPGWAYGDHDALPYVMQADHRSVMGRIVSRGRKMLAQRLRGVVTLTDPDDGTVVVLNGLHWCVPVEGAPVLSPENYPELFLPA